MHWTDEGIVLCSRRYGERKLITTVLTDNYGKYKGVLPLNKDNKFSSQIANINNLSWNARLRDHLGLWKFETINSTSAYFMKESLLLQTVNSACHLIDQCSPEREKATDLYQSLKQLILSFYKQNILLSLKKYCILEISLISHAGLQLDWSKCTVSNSTINLRYISPKSGKAVCEEIGQPYKNLLFVLPEFLQTENLYLDDFTVNITDIQQALRISSFFLQKYVFDVHHLTELKTRKYLISKLQGME